MSKHTRFDLMSKTKIRNVGGYPVVTLSGKMLAVLDTKDGDTVYITRLDDNGFRTRARDPASLEVLAAAEEAMDENCILLQELSLR